MADLFELSATLFLDTSQYEKETKNALNKFKEIEEYLTGLAKKQFSIVIDVATNFVGDVFEHGFNFEEATGAVFALTQETDALKRKEFETTAITEAAASTFTTAEVAAAGMYEALAGFTQDEVTAGLHGIIVTAEAAGENLKPIADILTDTVTAFGDGADDMEHYGDVLAATATSTNTTITQMGQALKYVAPLAHALGYEVDETAFFIGLLGDNAIKSSQAGTTLRNVFTRIATNAGATQKDLGALEILTEKLGVSFYDAQGKARPLKNVIDEMRDAWQGLSDIDREDVINSFNAAIGSTEEAEATLKDFETDVKTVTDLYKEMNSLPSKDKEGRAKFAAEIEAIGTQYDELLKLLGIEIGKGGINSYADALEKASIKLGTMDDKTRVYYAKQMGGLRGISGVLAILNYDMDEYNRKWDTISNSEGAADTMRQERLNNLRGDLKKLEASYDALVTTIFLDVREPLRPLVQSATSAIDEIRDAIIEDGLEGGIKKAAEKLSTASETFGPILNSIGKDIIGPIIDGILDEDVIHKFDAAVIQLGKSFVSGILEGSGLDSVGGWGRIAHIFLGQPGNTLGALFGWDTENDDSYSKLPVFEARIQVDEQATVDEIQAALDYARDNGNFWVEINGLTFGTDQSAEEVKKLLDVDDGQHMARTIADNFVVEMDRATGQIYVRAATDLANAGVDGGADAAAGYYGAMDEASAQVGEILATDLNNAGVDGGADMAANVQAEMDAQSQAIADTVTDKIGNGGTRAGNILANGIQSVLSGTSFFANVTGFISTVFNGIVRRNASAMTTGRIFRKPTIFGYDGGQFQMAGDAGAEAVVGVYSLERMITNAVSRAMPTEEVVSYDNPSANGRPLVLSIDGREFARVFVPYVNDENARVGVKLAKGGAY